MPRFTAAAIPTMFLALAGAGGLAHAGTPAPLDDAALKAYAAKPFDKGALMGQTVQLGRHHGLPLVAEFPCSDVCPQYTVRIIHYVLPEGVDCAGAGGVEKRVNVPVAITVLPKLFCVPKALEESGDFYKR